MIHRLLIGQVTLPDSHPRAAERTCRIYCFAIETPDGIVVVDTGPRAGHPVIDELFRPEVTSIVDELNGVGFDEREVVAVVNTHLHFDHCGQNHRLGNASVWVTEAEQVAAQAEFYTVAEWATIEPERLRLSTDGEEIAPGVRLIHTPGHTPGHQSVAVVGNEGTELIVGQACYTCAEFKAGQPAETDMHDADWLEVGRRSLARLRAMKPTIAHFSHDARVYGGTEQAV